MTYHYAEVAAPKGAPLLFLFHGTGGNETDLVGLGTQLMPGAHIISPRGDISEGGAPRFFKRVGMGVFDMPDLARATDKMATFIAEHIGSIAPRSVAALGYSNGANILASVMFARPELIDRGVLMHPMIPFDPPAQPGLAGRHVLMTAGRRDQMVPAAATQRLIDYFTAQGAAIEVAWHEGQHEIQQSELRAAQRFLAHN